MSPSLKKNTTLENAPPNITMKYVVWQNPCGGRRYSVAVPGLTGGRCSRPARRKWCPPLTEVALKVLLMWLDLNGPPNNQKRTTKSIYKKGTDKHCQAQVDKICALRK